jgi:hypothetical protein
MEPAGPTRALTDQISPSSRTIKTRLQVCVCRIWGIHSGGYEEYHLLGYDAVLSYNRRFGAELPPACWLVFAEIISSTLKMEAICSSERSVVTQQTTRRHIPEDDTLQVCVWLSRWELFHLIQIPAGYSAWMWATLPKFWRSRRATNPQFFPPVDFF